MVVVEKLTKVAYFIPGDSTYLSNDVEQVFITDVVMPHVVPRNILVDMDDTFTSMF